MFNENWERWEPIKGLTKGYYILSISEGSLKGQQFEILLGENNNYKNKIRILFENSVNSYQRNDETFRFMTLNFLEQKYGTKFYCNWNFFKITNSNYLKFISKESGSISDEFGLKHFLIADDDIFLDIIAGYEPKVELIYE